MGRALAPVDQRVIGDVLMEISSAPWFEPDDISALAFYLMYRYSRGSDAASLKAHAEPFAREWFRIGLGRFDALASYINQTHGNEMTRMPPIRHRAIRRA